MIEVNSVLYMGLWELVLLLLVVDVVIVVRFITRRRREKASIERLVTLVRQNVERRKKETRDLLEKKYGYCDEKLEQTTKKIIREEKRIYQTLANLFTTRDSLAIENLMITFEEAVEPYRTLELPKVAEGGEADGEERDSGTEMEQLKRLNQKLSDELKVTMNTISRMLHEYATIFSETGRDKNDQDDVAQLIVNDPALENGAQENAKNNTADEAVGMAVSTGATAQETDEAVDMPAEGSADDENLDSAALVGMFQEDDDASAQESADEEGTAASSTDADASVAVLVEESDSELENGKSAEEVLDQEIGEALACFDTDPTDLDAGGVTAEAAVDPVEELLAQAIDETVENHETPLPELQEEKTEAAADSIDELLAQAASGAEQNNEELPEILEVNVPDEQHAEKPLTGEVTERLNDASAHLSDEDIDSLLQGAVEERLEK
ncbi:MAG: hypothetical protein L3J26_04725 [Candidatus Polarisedimenticolaceae bacterium]|nr:hypothetical protein [Candidatus Polarisedimenticolaceae bacterium]